MTIGIQYRTSSPDAAASFRAAWRRKAEEVTPMHYSTGSGGFGRPALPETDAEASARKAKEIEALEDPERWDGMA